MRPKLLARPRRSFRPRLEVLEDRTTPAVFTVTTPADVVSSADDDVSLREAILGANAIPGPDTIAFDIIGPGVKTITIVGSALPTITDSLVIDGFTQPGAAPNTNPIDQPSNAVILIELVNGPDFPRDGLSFRSDGNTVRGLAMGRFGTAIYLTGSNNRIAGNYLGTNAAGTAAVGNARGVFVNKATTLDPVNNIIGGLNPADRNVFVGGTIPASIGVRAELANNLTVVGNFFGTNSDGTSYLGIGDGVNLGSSTSSFIGGTIPQARNVIVSNGFGVIFGATNNTSIQGNYIGTDRTGTVGLRAGIASSYGIRLDSFSSGNMIGGSTTGAGNVIGHYGIGIGVAHDTTRHVIQGNHIGTDVSGTLNLGNSYAGIVLSNPGTTENLIGGVNANEGNRIAFNGAGIVVGSGGFGAFLGNSIYGNVPTAAQPSGLGIDLLPNSGQTGPTLNDPGDTDTAGGNGFQNFPVLTSAILQGADTTIGGTFNSLANERFRIEFFANALADASSYGEGQTYLGFVEVLTDAAGDAAFQTSVLAPPVGQSVITATATWLYQLDAGGVLPWATSEFSATIATSSGNTPPVANSADVTLDEDTTLTITLSATDADANDVTFQLVSGPQYGTLGPIGQPYCRIEGEVWLCTAPVQYTPNPNYHGEDAFTFRVNDGQADSNIATVRLIIRPVNDRPTASASPDSLVVRANATATPVTLLGTDVETSLANLTFRISDAPYSGTLRLGSTVLQNGSTFTGSPANVTYTPNAGYTGTDEFVFVTVDRGDPDNGPAGSAPPLESFEVTVPITVRPVEPPTVTISDAVILEGHAGTRNLVFTISLSDTGTVPIEIAVATAQTTATAGKDFYSIARILRFPVGGPTSQQVAVRIIGERLVEADETFVMNILNARGASIADGQGVASILNDDAQPTMSISDALMVQRPGGILEAVFSIRLTSPTHLPISVIFRTADGTALAGVDYRAVTQTLTFRPGGPLVQQVRVRVFGPPNRTFFARLTDVNNSVITRSEGLGVI